MVRTIDVEQVTGVLLADGWHFIQPGSFRIEEYEFASVEPDAPRAGPARGFSFSKIDQLTRRMQWYAGPFGYLLAVRYDLPTEVVADHAEEGSDGSS